MLDIKFIRENPEIVKENIRKKFQEAKLPLVDEVIALDAQRRAAISEARFAQVVSRMRESTEAMLDTKQLPAIVKLASSSFGITEDESNGVLEHLITDGDFSLYGLANAVTRFSQDVESYDRATKLEEIGYSVMTMSPALFRQMNRTELLAA